MVAVTLVLAWFGEDATVLAADTETVVTDGVVEADMVGLAVGTVLELVRLDRTVFTVVVVTVVAVVGEDVEVAEAETFWVAAGAEVTIAGVDVDDRAEACGKSFTAVVLVVTDFTVVVTAGATLTVFDITLEVIVASGTDAGAALTAMSEDDTVDVVAAGVVLCGPVDFTVVETEGFGSTGALEAVETTSVGCTPVGVDVTVLAGGKGVVVVGVAVAGIIADGETGQDTWVDAGSALGAVARAELTHWAEADVEATTERGAGAVGACTDAATGVEASSVVVGD